MNGLNAADYLWIMQRQAVLELAEKGSCVIVGRCADYILRENPDCLHVSFMQIPNSVRNVLCGCTEKVKNRRNSG